MKALVAILLLCASCAAVAQSLGVPGLDIRIDAAKAKPEEVATALKILAVLTALTLAPAALVVMTAFTRIIVVLAMLRMAIGMQETPPNSVLVSLALFLTLFTMQPVLSQIDSQAFQPYVGGKMGFERAAEAALQPLREFMIRQTRETDLMLMLDVSQAPAPQDVDEVRTVHLVPAFMLSELKTAFQIGFVVFLPFLLLDIVVSSVLMSMGMLMVPPMMISLPLKLLMFVLIDGWNLVVKALLGSFH
ncbi:MAG: flagellar type III secretion system pore protein FliP [Burkholderiales bacterium]